MKWERIGGNCKNYGNIGGEEGIRGNTRKLEGEKGMSGRERVEKMKREKCLKEARGLNDGEKRGVGGKEDQKSTK